MILFSPLRRVKKGFPNLYNVEPPKIDTIFCGLLFVSYMKLTEFLFCLRTQLCLFWRDNTDYEKHHYSRSEWDTSFISLAHSMSINAVCSVDFFHCGVLGDQVVIRPSHFLNDSLKVSYLIMTSLGHSLWNDILKVLYQMAGWPETTEATRDAI
mgnify:CR=1 FL=1